MFTNVSDKYGDQVKVTIEDYRELNPTGIFEVKGDEIREYFSDKPGDFEIVARRATAKEIIARRV